MTIRGFFIGVVTVLVIGALVGWWLWQPSEDSVVDPHGEDAHGHVDPTEDDPYVIARMIAGALYSYSPAEDETPLVQITQLQERLTGEMTKAVEVPADPQALDALYPRHWESWKRSQAVVRGVAETLNYEKTVSGNRVTAKMHVRQIVYFTDGDTIPWRSFDMEMDMVLDHGAWKAAAFRVVSVNGSDHDHE